MDTYDLNNLVGQQEEEEIEKAYPPYPPPAPSSGVDLDDVIGTQTECDRCGCWSDDQKSRVEVSHDPSTKVEYWCEECEVGWSWVCQSCETTMGEDVEKTYNEAADENFCPRCADDCFVCGSCERVYHPDYKDSDEVGGDTWCSSCIDEHTVQCQGCNAYCVLEDDGYHSDGDTIVCQECWDDGTWARCPHCDKIHD